MTAIRWTRRALLHLDSIAGYVRELDPKAADRVTKRIRDRIRQLADHPQMGRPGREPGTRELFVGRYRYKVVYRVTTAVEILAVFHTAQDPEASNDR